MGIELLDLVLPYGLSQLSKRGFDVCMTGSRVLGGATKDSDWDVFVQDSSIVRQYLNNHWSGFSVVPESQLYAEQYDDPEISLLYRCVDNNTKDVVDVQLVRNYKHKKAAQKWIQDIFPKGYLKSLGKQNAKYIWRIAYGLAKTKGE